MLTTKKVSTPLSMILVQRNLFIRVFFSIILTQLDEFNKKNLPLDQNFGTLIDMSAR